MKTFQMNSPISRTHVAIVSPDTLGGATVTVRDGYQSRDTTAVRTFASVEAAKVWSQVILAKGAYTSEGSL